jgi:hypothetical protein
MERERAMSKEIATKTWRERYDEARAPFTKIEWMFLDRPDGLLTYLAAAFLLLTILLFRPMTLQAIEHASPVLLLLALTSWLLFHAAAIMRVYDRSRLLNGKPQLDRNGLKRLRREPLLLLLASLAVLSAIAFFGKLDASAVEAAGLTPFILHGGLFGWALAFSFVPAMIAAFLTERSITVGHEDRAFWRTDAITGGSVLGAAIAAIFVVAIGWSAGQNFMQKLQGTGIGAMIGVIGAFAFFIVASSVSRGANAWREREERTAVNAAGFGATVEQIASGIDTVLVRVVAPIMGVTQAKDGKHGIGFHHLYVIAIMSALTFLGFVLPEPTGLLPIALAFLFALAIGRRWSWVEADRETASRLRTDKSKDIHIGFGNDLRDESLIAYLFLFILLPLALYQINDQIHAFKPAHDSASLWGSFQAWVGFFGLELLKAVPLVDWAEIYGGSPSQYIVDANPADPTDRHVLFAARVVVDFVVMAALFQAISIFQRNRSQRELYKSGQLDILDPILEEEFFERGMIEVPGEKEADTRKKQGDENPIVTIGTGNTEKIFTARQHFKTLVEHHVEKHERQAHDEPTPYDHRRLNALMQDPRQEVQAGARWMVKKYGLLLGSFGDKTVELNRQWPEDLTSLSIQKQRNEKERFDRLLNEASRDQRLETDEDLGILVSMVEKVNSNNLFASSIDQVIDILSEKRTEKAVLLLGLFVMIEKHRLEAPALLKQYEDRLGIPLPGVWQGQGGRRKTVYRKLEDIGTDAARASHIARQTALAITSHMSAKIKDDRGKDVYRDGAEISRKAALLAADAISDSLRPAETPPAFTPPSPPA